MTDEAKVRFLFRKVQQTFKSFTNDAYDHLLYHGFTPFNTATSYLPEYIAKNARNVSGSQVGDETKVGYGIYNEDG